MPIKTKERRFDASASTDVPNTFKQEACYMRLEVVENDIMSSLVCAFLPSMQARYQNVVVRNMRYAYGIRRKYD